MNILNLSILSFLGIFLQFLVVNGTGEEPSKQQLEEMLAKANDFSNKLMSQLLGKCNSMTNALQKAKNENAQEKETGEEHQMFCGMVHSLEDPFKKLTNLAKMEQRQHRHEDHKALEQLFMQIYHTVLVDTVNLDIHYSNLIDVEEAKRLWFDVAQVRVRSAETEEGGILKEDKQYEMQLRENFNEHFKQLVQKLKMKIQAQEEGEVQDVQHGQDQHEKVPKKAASTRGTGSAALSPRGKSSSSTSAEELAKDAYELLQTSKFMGFQFDWSLPEKFDYALKQLVVNTLIHGLSLKQSHAFAVDQWAIGMDEWVITHEKQQAELIKKFKNLYAKLKPLMTHCQEAIKDHNDEDREAKHLCQTLDHLKEPFEKLEKMDEKHLKDKAKEVDLLFDKCHENFYFDDLIGLDLLLADELTTEKAREVWIAIARVRNQGIGPNERASNHVHLVRQNMNSHWKKLVGQLMAQMAELATSNTAADDGHSTGLAKARLVAYEIVQIAKYMGFEFDWSDTEAFDWTLQEMAVHLMVYGLRVKEARGIVDVDDWEFGMDEWL